MSSLVWPFLIHLSIIVCSDLDQAGDDVDDDLWRIGANVARVCQTFKTSPTGTTTTTKTIKLSLPKWCGYVRCLWHFWYRVWSPFNLAAIGSPFDANEVTQCKVCNILEWHFFKKKWANPGLFFVYFWSFQTNNIIFTTNQCEKCHVHSVYGAGIQTHDFWNMSLLP